MAQANCVIGCMPLGKALIMDLTCAGTVDRAANSADKAVVWASVGISPVSKSHMRPSGSGSSPPLAVGSCSCSSGILYPRKRIPSSESSSDVSYTMQLTPRIPPYACATVHSPSFSPPMALRTAMTFSCSAGSSSANRCFKPEISEDIARRVTLSVWVDFRLRDKTPRRDIIFDCL